MRKISSYFRICASNQILPTIAIRMRHDVEVLSTVSQPAILVGAQFKAYRVESELEFRRCSDEKRVRWFRQTVESEANFGNLSFLARIKGKACHGQGPRMSKDYPHISQINFLRPSLVIQVAALLRLAKINPIVQSHHCAVLHLGQEDVLEAG